MCRDLRRWQAGLGVALNAGLAHWRTAQHSCCSPRHAKTLRCARDRSLSASDHIQTSDPVSILNGQREPTPMPWTAARPTDSCVTATIATPEPRRLRKNSHCKGSCSGVRHSVRLELHRDDAQNTHQLSCALIILRRGYLTLRLTADVFPRFSSISCSMSSNRTA